MAAYHVTGMWSLESMAVNQHEQEHGHEGKHRSSEKEVVSSDQMAYDSHQREVMSRPRSFA